MEAGTTAAPAGRAPDSEGPLRRAIGRRMLLFFILGDILGAGIYALVGEVGGEIGGAVWVAFTVGLVLALCTAFAYAELVTKYPHAGGAALYINHAFKRPFLTFMVAFAVMASGVTSASTLARAFAGDYLEEFVSVPTTLAALVFIGIVALINFRGISESVKTNMVLTVVELTGLLIIILIGLWVLGNGDGEIGRNFEFKEGENVFVAILAGTALAFYALIGFEDSANVAEETQEPTRSYPFALFAGILIAGGIYFLVTFAASLVVPAERLIDSDGPLLEVVREGSSIPTRLFSAIALLAIANGALIKMIMASRLLYGMSKEKIMPGALGRVHEGRRTPWVAIVFTTLLAVVLISVGTLEDLAAATVILLLLVFTLVNLAVLVLRRERVDHAHFTTRALFPVLGIVISIALLIKLATDKDVKVLVITALVLAAGALLWVATRLLGSGTGHHDSDASEPGR